MSESEPIQPELGTRTFFSLTFEFDGRLAPDFLIDESDPRARALNLQILAQRNDGHWAGTRIYHRHDCDLFRHVVSMQTGRAAPYGQKESVFEEGTWEVMQWLEENFPETRPDFLSVWLQSFTDSSKDREDKTVDARAFVERLAELRQAEPQNFGAPKMGEGPVQ